MENYFKEKRSHPRFPANFQVDFSQEHSDEITTAKSRDVSASGICIIAFKDIPVGATLDIYIYLPDNGEEIFRKGRVIWSALFEDGSYRAGIKIEDPPLKPIPMVLRSIKSQNNY